MSRVLGRDIPRCPVPFRLLVTTSWSGSEYNPPTSQSLATHEVAIYRGFTGELRVVGGVETSLYLAMIMHD